MPSRQILDLTENLQKAFLTIKARFEFENRKLELRCICSHRSPEEQTLLWQKGRKDGIIVNRKQVVTFCDGIKTKSNHNYMPSKAFDVGIFKNGKYIGESPLYKILNKFTAGLSVRWGGSFNSFKDYPHFEEL